MSNLSLADMSLLAATANKALSEAGIPAILKHKDFELVPHEEWSPISQPVAHFCTSDPLSFEAYLNIFKSDTSVAFYITKGIRVIFDFGGVNEAGKAYFGPHQHLLTYEGDPKDIVGLIPSSIPILKGELIYE